MLNIWGAKHRAFCDRLTRRDFLRVGALGLGGLTLADFLRLRGQGAVKPKSPHKAVILVCMEGGPSHIDMYDMKPDAPAEVRGEFKPIKTNVPGMDICELMPLQAKLADKLAIVRGLKTSNATHDLDEVFTGFTRPAKRPPFGAVVSRLRAAHGNPLHYVSLVKLFDAGQVERNRQVEEPGYVGAANRPFVPSGPGLENLKLTSGLTFERLAERQQLLNAFDAMRKDIDAQHEMAGLDSFTAKALDVISSTKVADAFDITREPEKVKAKYDTGNDKKYREWGASCLLARRLVVAGVPVVTLNLGSWDDHGGTKVRGKPGYDPSIFDYMKVKLPRLDQCIHALVTDISERGLDKDVAVVMFGEFGRTPRINNKPNPGRGHWPDAGFALAAGGGWKMGQVIGETDAHAERAKGKPYTPQNLFATLYDLLGIDPATTLPDHQGRPMCLLDEREPIRELV